MSHTVGSRSGRSVVLLAVLSIALAAAAYLLVRRGGSVRGPAAKHLVLVVFDTLRADRMSINGHPARTTPFLEGMSGQLLRYGSVKATAPWTIPSHASLFTGLWPSEHGAQWGSFRLEDSRITLAEILASRGFCTVGLSANSFVSEPTGLSQGFQAFQVFEPDRSPRVLRTAATVLDRAPECGRIFLFVNLMDTHIPYRFEPHAEEFGVTRPPLLSSADKWAVSSGERVLTEAEVEQHRAAYDAAVRLTDDLARAVIGILRDRRLLDETLVVFTSDHGDGLGEHPEMGHVLSVWEEQLDVPLLVRLPGGRRGGEVYERRISLVGLAPSILDWLGVPRPAELEDRPTLERTADGPIIADYRSYFTEDERSFNRRMRERYPGLAARVSHHHVTYCSNHKLVVSPGGRRRLYDLEADPAEQHDLAGRDSPQLRSCLGRYQDASRAGLFSPFDRVVPGSSMSEEDLERLKALGYLQ